MTERRRYCGRLRTEAQIQALREYHRNYARSKPEKKYGWRNTWRERNPE